MRSILFTVAITLFLSLLLQSLVDPAVFAPVQWDADTIANILHTWFAFTSVYYLFGFVVQYALKGIQHPTSGKFFLILFSAQMISFLWFLGIDLLYYKMYYQIDSLEETTFFEFDLPLSFAVLTIGSFYFYHRNFIPPIANTTHEPSEIPELTEIEINTPTGIRIIALKDIALIYMKMGLTRIQTFAGETFTLDTTIKDLSQTLDPYHFFRLNRQVIVSRKAISGYKRLAYQKLNVELSVSSQENNSLIVSKYRAAEFKNWLAHSTIN